MRPHNYSQSTQAEAYSEYKERTEISSKRDVSDVLNNIKGGSLKSEDKRKLLKDLLTLITKEI